MTPDRPPVADLDAARALFAHLANAPQERVAIAYLDPKWRLCGMRHIIGGADRVPVPIRLVAHDALAFDAHGVLMAHNHPSGDPTPSDGDLAFTRVLARGLAALEIVLLDHLVFAGERVVSLRAQGVI